MRLNTAPTALRAAVTAAYRRPEPDCVAALLPAARLPPEEAREAQALAMRLTRRLREHGVGIGRHGIVQALLHEFSLSSQEGVALMCLAEALLRIPDNATRDALIRDKIGGGHWQRHTDTSAPLFVHAATWGLVVTGKLVATHTESGLAGALARAVARGGEPLIRKAVDLAMRLLGEQFVSGETIALALARSRKREAQGFRFSYDMLGEAALDDADARRYLAAYEEAIDAIGAASDGRGIIDGPGVSIKLSALHPRYGRAQRGRTMRELYPRLLGLAVLARRHDIGLNIDAEEADRLELSLELLERLCFEPALAGWNGIGFVAQAYQKRCARVVDFLVDLARRSGHRLMVRLVKGAYWDSEIKRAQLDGLDYPVYTRKAHTDVSYLACARRLLEASQAVYPQFATHNARTLAGVVRIAGAQCAAGRYEFQCLHGMGEPLYEQVVRSIDEGGLGRPCRIYAPVGTHETLLAYLVRRLLENGANSSFVHAIADETVALEELVADPVDLVEAAARTEGAAGLPHPRIVRARDLYAPHRVNSAGIDLSDETCLERLSAGLADSARSSHVAAPMLAQARASSKPSIEVRNPADRRELVGCVDEADEADVAIAVAAAAHAAPGWARTPVDARAAMLEAAGERFEHASGELIALLVREAGKTLPAAIAEVREAIDSLRYYAFRVRHESPAALARALGPVACISPWNFPLAIFTGQVAAALAVGNTVLAKPAEQTPLVAATAVRMLHDAGVPPAALQLLPGPGSTVGAALAADERIRGVVFTGSTEVARTLQRALAGRLDEHGDPLVLVAETGGQNAMIVDSSALAEQAVADVLASAFDSAGQRCSAARVLFVQEEVAERISTMLRGAMCELRVGRPDRLSTDVGPVIDVEARDALLAHVEAMRAGGHRVFQPPIDAHGAEALAHGTFVVPTLIEIDGIGELRQEVFGPVLHLVRYARNALDEVVRTIDATGHGLTFGIQTRIDETVEYATSHVHAGNQYVNRNMIGAVVGVQPFGGEGLSGTGPKAGGPLYLRRLMKHTSTAPGAPLPEGVALPPPRAPRRPPALQRLGSLQAWLGSCEEPTLRALAAVCETLLRDSPLGRRHLLPGPTGERNTWYLVPREATLCIAQDDADRLHLLAHVLAAGSTALWLDDERSRRLHSRLPTAVQAAVRCVDDPDTEAFAAAIVHGDAALVADWSRRLAQREGPIATLQALVPGAHGARAIDTASLMAERSLSVNTAAAGGNASLLALVGAGNAA